MQLRAKQVIANIHSLVVLLDVVDLVVVLLGGGELVVVEEVAVVGRDV